MKQDYEEESKVKERMQLMLEMIHAFSLEVLALYQLFYNLKILVHEFGKRQQDSYWNYLAKSYYLLNMTEKCIAAFQTKRKTGNVKVENEIEDWKTKLEELHKETEANFEDIPPLFLNYILRIQL